MSSSRVALVTGATGQDGGYLVERLLADGLEVHATARRSADAAAAPWLSRAVLHEVDLQDTDALAGLVRDVGADEVYNLAAVSSVAQSWRDPLTTARINGLAVAALLQACEDSGRETRFVQASSAEIFGASQEVPQTEQTPVAPVNPYGAAKAYAHQLTGVYRHRGLHASACILFPHESVRRPDTFVSRKITRTAAAVSLGLESELVMGDLTPRRDWGWAPDYVDAMVRAARHPEAGDFVIATGRAHSVGEFVAAAFAAVGITDWRPLVRQDPQFMRPAEAVDQQGDPTRARELLGWEPTVGFEEIVSRMVQADLELLKTPSR